MGACHKSLWFVAFVTCISGGDPTAADQAPRSVVNTSKAPRRWSRGARCARSLRSRACVARLLPAPRPFQSHPTMADLPADRVGLKGPDVSTNPGEVSTVVRETRSVSRHHERRGRLSNDSEARSAASPRSRDVGGFRGGLGSPDVANGFESTYPSTRSRTTNPPHSPAGVPGTRPAGIRPVTWSPTSPASTTSSPPANQANTVS